MLRKNQRIRIRLLDRHAEPLPKQVVELLYMAQISGYIKPPAVCVIRRRYPFRGYAQYLPA